jgi:hypothetical protein
MDFARYRCAKTADAETSRLDEIERACGREIRAPSRHEGCTSGVKLTEAEDRLHAEAPPRRAEPAPQRRKQSAAAPTPSAQMTEWPPAPDGKCNRSFRHSDSVQKCYSGTRILHRNDLPSAQPPGPSRPQKRAAQQRLVEI